MNYFAHYFFDHQPGEPYYNLGLILPDFARSAPGKRKLHLENVKEGDINGLLKNGCRIHYEADEWFHDSSFFSELQTEISGVLNKKPALFANQRTWFISHILAELLLDRVLIMANKDLLNQFYSDLENTDIRMVTQFLQLCGKREFSLFEKYYSRFCEVKYLYQYVEDEKLVFALNRIISGTGQENLLPAAMEHLQQNCDYLTFRADQIKKPRQMARLQL